MVMQLYRISISHNIVNPYDPNTYSLNLLEEKIKTLTSSNYQIKQKVFLFLLLTNMKTVVILNILKLDYKY